MVQETKDDDLWPSDLIPQEKIITPSQILMEQASALDRKTNGIVLGKVTGNDTNHNFFLFDFYITSATINYSYKLFTIRHVITLYPVDIMLDEELVTEVIQSPSIKALTNVSINDKYGAKYIIAQNVDGFKGVLKLVFGASKTIKIIKSLYSLNVN
jgi:hypothetical protein